MFDFSTSKNLPIYSWILSNLFGIALMGFAWSQGWVQMFWTMDNTHISKIIFALFLLAQFIGFLRVRELSEIMSSGAKIGTNFNAWQVRWTKKVTFFAEIGKILVFLGLLGTVIGFKHALVDVDPNGGTDPESMKKMMSTLFDGINYMMYTTIAGMVFSLWLKKTFLILRSSVMEIVAREQED